MQSFGQVEFTQPLGVGLALAVRINNQYSHPVCTGRRMGAYATINDTWEISWVTGCLLRNVDVGIREFVGMGYFFGTLMVTLFLSMKWVVQVLVGQPKRSWYSFYNSYRIHFPRGMYSHKWYKEYNK